MSGRIYVIRHGQTEWSLTGRHTSRTDVDLTAIGEGEARALGARLKGIEFAQVLASPRLRARRTAELAGLGASAVVSNELAEWDYGDFEGKKTAEIQTANPGWNLFRDGCPNGESPAAVGARADRLLAGLRDCQGNVALFSHGHMGRVLGARWVGLPASEARVFLLDTACFGILDCEHGNPAAPVIALWNENPAGKTG